MRLSTARTPTRTRDAGQHATRCLLSARRSSACATRRTGWRNSFCRHLSLLNPVLYMVNAIRFGILGVSDIGMPAAMLTISAFTAGLFALCLVLLDKGVGLRA